MVQRRKQEWNHNYFEPNENDSTTYHNCGIANPVHREIHSIKCIHYQEPEKEEQVKFNEEKGKQGRSE
jgi:hypothetical protein